MEREERLCAVVAGSLRHTLHESLIMRKPNFSWPCPTCQWERPSWFWRQIDCLQEGADLSCTRLHPCWQDLTRGGRPLYICWTTSYTSAPGRRHCRKRFSIGFKSLVIVFERLDAHRHTGFHCWTSFLGSSELHRHPLQYHSYRESCRNICISAI